MFTTSRFEENGPTENIGDCIITQITTDIAEAGNETNYKGKTEEGNGNGDLRTRNRVSNELNQLKLTETLKLKKSF